jgi:hypothetical protein
MTLSLSRRAMLTASALAPFASIPKRWPQRR